MKRIAAIVLMCIALTGCATTGAPGESFTHEQRAVIGGSTIYVGQSKANVEQALGAPDSVEVIDPSMTMIGALLQEEIKAHGEDYKRIYWKYNRDGKRFEIRFKEGVDSVDDILEFES